MPRKKRVSDAMTEHAVVIGGSMAGLLAACVLSDHFERVTIVERDRFPDGAGARRGVPQGRHAHALLPRGFMIMTNFDLGQTNTVDALSRLVGSTNNALLKIDNDNGGASATALDLRVEPGQAPMKVDSSTKVVGLNVDEVDSKSASAFLGTGDKAADAIHADQADQATKADDAANAGAGGVALAAAADRVWARGRNVAPGASCFVTHRGVGLGD